MRRHRAKDKGKHINSFNGLPSDKYGGKRIQGSGNEPRVGLVSNTAAEDALEWSSGEKKGRNFGNTLFTWPQNKKERGSILAIRGKEVRSTLGGKTRKNRVQSKWPEPGTRAGPGVPIAYFKSGRKKVGGEDLGGVTGS